MVPAQKSDTKFNMNDKLPKLPFYGRNNIYGLCLFQQKLKNCLKCRK